MTTTPPEIPTIATHEQRTRQQQRWRTLVCSVAVLQGYVLLYPWLPHPLRLPLAWIALLPPLLPAVAVVLLGWWWQPWRQRLAAQPFEHMPPDEDPLP